MIRRYCDRCNAELADAPTARAQVTDREGHSLAELCELCSVKLRRWIEEGKP